MGPEAPINPTGFGRSVGRLSLGHQYDSPRHSFPSQLILSGRVRWSLAVGFFFVSLTSVPGRLAPGIQLVNVPWGGDEASLRFSDLSTTTTSRFLVVVIVVVGGAGSVRHFGYIVNR